MDWWTHPRWIDGPTSPPAALLGYSPLLSLPSLYIIYTFSSEFRELLLRALYLLLFLHGKNICRLNFNIEVNGRYVNTRNITANTIRSRNILMMIDRFPLVISYVDVIELYATFVSSKPASTSSSIRPITSLCSITRDVISVKSFPIYWIKNNLCTTVYI